MNDDPLQLVDLTTARTEFEAAVMVNALESRGIRARVFGLVGSTMQWEIAATQPIRVQVMRKDVEAAHAALTETRQDSVDIDWSEVDVGEPETPLPPRREIGRSLDITNPSVRRAVLVAFCIGAFFAYPVLSIIAFIAAGVYEVFATMRDARRKRESELRP